MTEQLSMLRYIGVYEVDRHYGGPEEGGWWYNTSRYMDRSEAVLVENEDCYEDSEIERVRAALRAEYEDMQPRYDIYSCANDGPQYEFYIEEVPGEFHSTGRQHYE